MKELLTIVIPCKNESYNISNLLKNINSQFYIKGVEVFVADSSDDLSTYLHIISETGKTTNVRMINGGLPSVARHNGALKCSTPYILFLDADMVIESPTFISTILNEIIKKQGTLLTCKVRTTDNTYNKLYKGFDLIQKLHRITGPFALGGIMLFKTSDYFELGGFNFEDEFAEDYNLSKKVNSDNFILSNEIIKTSPRRFKNKGVYYMIKMMLLTYLNRNNKDFYKKSHSYWS